MNAASYENYNRSPYRGGSDRSFGFVFAAVFAILALLPARSGHPIRKWALSTSVVFLVIALIRPEILNALNHWWTYLGLGLGRVLNPIGMALVYFLIFTPVALLFRALKRDSLALHLDADAGTYWILRDPSPPGPENMRNQF
jgi:hypothetical protein